MVPLLAAPGLSSPDAVAQAAGNVALTADKAKPAVDQPVTLTAKVRKTGSISEGLAWLERALAAAPKAPDVVQGAGASRARHTPRREW